MKKFLALLLSVMLIASSFVGCSSSTSTAPTQQNTAAEANGASSAYKAGTYTASSQGNNGPVKVEVVFTEKSIESVKVTEHSETSGISDAAIERIPTQIVESQSLNIDTVSGATNSSKAILNAVADAVGQAGGDVEALKIKAVETSKGKDEEKTVDILVVGGGTSGTTAALAAAEAGAKVLVIEANATPGGAGAMTGATTYAPGSSLDSETKEQASARIQKDLDFLMDYTHYNANMVLLRNYLNNTGRAVDMLMEEGLLFTSKNNDHIVKYTTRGTQQFIDIYKTMAQKYDVELMTETHGDALLTDDKGNITGATATKADGGTLTINAKKVILATGGFGGNKELIKELVPNYVEDATNEGMYADGSGHEMAWAIGAEKSSAGIQVHNNSLPQIALDAGVSTRSGNDIDDIYSLANTPLLWVNSDGMRFANEDIMYSATLSGNVIYKEGTVFVVFDQDTADKAIKEGVGLKAWRGDAAVPLDELAAQIEEGIKTGYVFKGDTLADLAQSTGMTVDTLETTVARYNELVKDKNDKDYGKDPQYLAYTVENGPYYAVQLAPRYLGTFGGLTINNDYQVLNKEGHIIDGLYTVGFNAESWMGSTYVDFSGITMSFALTSGMLAGEHAAASLK